mgnify:CR=1 FL=1|jgi:hypothetical protein
MSREDSGLPQNHEQWMSFLVRAIISVLSALIAGS